MGWDRNKTINIFIIVLTLWAILMIAALALIAYMLVEAKNDGQNARKQWESRFLYILGGTFLTGLGCLWFRICHSQRNVSHAIIHTVALVLMGYGHRDMFELYDDQDKLLNKYPISLMGTAIYIFEYLLAFHVFVCRCGRTPAERAFRAGLHAFVGALTFFVCLMDGLLVCHAMARDVGQNLKITSHFGSLCIFGYGVCTWYLFLNPYFDWRRLKALAKSRPSKKANLKRSSSGMRNRSRSPNQPPIRSPTFRPARK